MGSGLQRIMPANRKLDALVPEQSCSSPHGIPEADTEETSAGDGSLLLVKRVKRLGGLSRWYLPRRQSVKIGRPGTPRLPLGARKLRSVRCFSEKDVGCLRTVALGSISQVMRVRLWSRTVISISWWAQNDTSKSTCS
jgi:hypothetical protein